MSMALILVTVFCCQKVPVSGRSQLTLVPQGELLALSNTEYRQFIQNHDVITETEQAQMVQTVGANIQDAVREYMERHGLQERLEGYEWEYNLIDSDTVNAFAMPGGKIVIYQGIMPIAQGPNGLAVVMAHEIAHVVAEHGNERMSQGLIVQLGGMALSVALREQPALTRQLFMAAYGVGSNVGVILPYSRTHESEADRLGLVFMAIAGYDPRAAVGFWQRMVEERGEGAPPEFLSTHPSGESRIADIQQAMPEALEFYRQAD
jgi:predicted Zn-dependent protease